MPCSYHNKNKVVPLDISGTGGGMKSARRSPIEDVELQDYLRTSLLNLTATTDLKKAVCGASYVIVATPTDHDSVTNHFDTSSVDLVTTSAFTASPDVVVVIKSTKPAGCVRLMREEL